MQESGILDNRIALSIDIEDWYHTPMITGSSFSRYKDTEEFFAKWKGDFDLITKPTLTILSLLEKRNIKATFFIVADTILRYPEIVEALKKSDHEIGCHGLHHHAAIDGNTKLNLQSPEVWENELVQAKAMLESAFERKIIGYRAPGGYFATWMVPIIEKAGFSYDSSISQNSFYNKTDVLKLDIPGTPYFLNRNDLSGNGPQTGIMELPWSKTKMLGRQWPTGGAFFFRLFGLNFFKFALQQNLKISDTMFYFHSLDLTEEKIPLSNFKKRPFYWINKGRTTLRRIEKLLDHFDGKFVSCEEVFRRAAKNYQENST